MSTQNQDPHPVICLDITKEQLIQAIKQGTPIVIRLNNKQIYQDAIEAEVDFSTHYFDGDCLLDLYEYIEDVNQMQQPYDSIKCFPILKSFYEKIDTEEHVLLYYLENNTLQALEPPIIGYLTAKNV